MKSYAQENSVGDRDAEHGQQQAAQHHEGEQSSAQDNDDDEQSSDGHIDTYA